MAKTKTTARPAVPPTPPVDPTPDDLDFVADARRVVASDAALANVARLADEAILLAKKVEWYEEKAKLAKEELTRVTNVALPEAMAACRLASFATADGHTVVVKDVVSANIPKTRLAEACDWLRTNGHGDLIKRKLAVALGRGQDALASKAVAALGKLGLAVADSVEVNHQTLSAFVRERTEAGIAVPDDLLGVFRGRVAKVEEPKEAKAKAKK